MKNNRERLENIKGDRTYFIIFNLLLYILIFCLFGAAAIFAISKVIMTSAKNEVSSAIDNIKKDAVNAHSLDSRFIYMMNQRMNIELYDSSNNLVASLGTFGIKWNSPVQIDNDEFILIEATYYSQYGDGDTNDTNDTVNLLMYSSAIDCTYTSDVAPGVAGTTYNISKVILYMNVDSEFAIRDEITRVYVISVIGILILSFIATYIMSAYAMRPIQKSLQKQLEFVSDASHELRTPLAIVQSKLENILSHSEATVMDVSDDIAISLNEVTRLSKLTNNLLTLSRSDKDNIGLELTECDVDEIVKTTAEAFIEMAEIDDKKMTIETVPVKAKIDKDKIRQVLVILLDNAIRYTNQGDSIDVNLSKSKDEIILKVSDTGMGISEETKIHIFDRFYREDKARSRATGGHGLGLSIAKTLILHHHGKIVVDHNHPKGTVFTITLPL